MDFNKIEAEERHIFKLWTLCRVCGQAGEKLQYCLDNYANLLELLYDIDLSKDDPAVHPQMVCQKCRLVLQQYLKKSAKSKKPKLPELYTFYKHGDECFVCDRASGLLPKRKLSIDTGDSASQAKIARQDNGQSIAQSEGEKNTEDVAGAKKGTTDEELSVQDTVRANVLLQAIQGAIADETLVADPEEMIDEPEQDGFTKYVYLNMIRRFKARNIKEEKAKESIDINRFNQKNFAYAFLTCSLCKRLPLKPVSTECKHIFCEACISDWLNFGNVCPKCEEVIVELSDASEQLNHLYMLLDAPCSFASKGCEAKLNPFEINGHEKHCHYNDKYESSISSEEEEEVEEEEEEVEDNHQEIQQNVARRKKRSLRYVSQKLANWRVVSMMEFVDETCKKEREDRIDVLFYMLQEALTETKDARAKKVDLLWRHKGKPLVVRGRGRPPSATKPVARRQSRRKGTPRKRGRPRKVPVEEQDDSSEEDEEDEEDEEVEEEGEEAKEEEDAGSGDEEGDEEEEEDLEKRDATWKPRSTIRRRQIIKDTEVHVAEEKHDKNVSKERDCLKDKEVSESKVQMVVQQVQENTSENIAIQVHVVIEDDKQPHQDSIVEVP